MKKILLALVLALWSASASAQTVRIGAGGGPGPVEIVVDGKTYMRIDKDGNIAAMNGAAFLVEGMTTGVATRVPYYDSTGRLTSSAGVSFDPTNGRFDVVGQSTGMGSVRATSLVTSEGFIRAAFIARRNGGTVAAPSSIAGDGAEFLVQVPDSSGNYANVGGFMCRTLDPSPAVMTGRCEFAVKPAGTYNTTFDYTQMVLNHNGNVGIGYYFGNTTLAAAPAVMLHLARDGSDPIGSAAVAIRLERASDDATGPGIDLLKKRGTLVTNAATATQDGIGSINFRGYESATPLTVTTASITGTAEDNYTASARGARLNFNITAIGSTSLLNVARITQAGFTAIGGAALAVANVGANSCGTTTATVAGGSNSGEVTVGATSGTQCRVTAPTAPVRYNGACTNTTTAALCRLVAVDTTHFDLLGTFTAGDVLSFITLPR